MKLIINKNKNVTDVNGKFSYFIKVVDDAGVEFAEYEQKIPATKYNQPDETEWEAIKTGVLSQLYGQGKPFDIDNAEITETVL
tara:strand:+ start:6110 stop:6358 length:249 start_codon:yes stop_codon:yes gene_type:complete